MSKGNHFIKEILYEQHGHYCWLCKEKFPPHELTLHHIIPRSYKGATSVKNGMILCKTCHFDIVNHIKYNSTQYWSVMGKALKAATTLKSRRLKSTE